MRTSANLSYEEYARKRSVKRIAHILDQSIKSHSDLKIDPKLMYVCFYFTRRCHLEDFRSQICKIFAVGLENHIMEAVERVYRALPITNASELACCVNSMWDLYKQWYMAQEDISRLIKDGIRIVAKSRRHFENSAKRCKEEGYIATAQSFESGAASLTACIAEYYAEITFEEYRLVAKEAEQDIVDNYTGFERPIATLYDVDSEIVFARGLLRCLRDLKTKGDGSSVQGLIASFQ